MKYMPRLIDASNIAERGSSSSSADDDDGDEDNRGAVEDPLASVMRSVDADLYCVII